MILTCPSCSTRYVLDSHALGARGRRVMCSACGEIWFQSPLPLEEDKDHDEDEDEDAGTDHASSSPPETPATHARQDDKAHRTDFEDSRPIELAFIDPETIPSAVRPLPEEPITVPPSSSSSFLPRINGFLAASVLFLFLAGGMTFLRHTIAGSWPAVIPLFEGIGLSVTIPAQGLVLDQTVRAAQDGQNHVIVSGQIFNRLETSQRVPPLRIILQHTDGTSTRQSHDLPFGVIAPDSQESFEIRAPLPENRPVSAVNVGFSLAVPAIARNEEETVQHAEEQDISVE